MDAGYRLFIVTNQSGIGRGYYTEADMHAVNDKLSAELAASDGVAFEKNYFAPESPEEDSPGRKPSPQFCGCLLEFGISLEQSYMVGDKTADLECGWNAGVKQSILVRTGYGAELEQAEPTLVARAAWWMTWSVRRIGFWNRHEHHRHYPSALCVHAVSRKTAASYRGQAAAAACGGALPRGDESFGGDCGHG